MKKNKHLNLKEIFSNISYQFNKKNFLVIFLLLLIGVLIPTLSGSTSFNFWYKIYNILNNPIYNILLFLSAGISVIYLSGDMMKNYIIISRYENLDAIIKKYMKDIAVFTIYLVLVSFILAIAGAILFCFGDFSMIKHPIYNIPIIIYIIFFLIRSIIFSGMINVIIFIIYILFNKTITTILVLLNSSAFVLNNFNNNTINHFYNMNLLYHSYYTPVFYSSFFLEIIISIFEFFIILLFLRILLKIVVNKKRNFI